MDIDDIPTQTSTEGLFQPAPSWCPGGQRPNQRANARNLDDPAAELAGKEVDLVVMPPSPRAVTGGMVWYHETTGEEWQVWYGKKTWTWWSKGGGRWWYPMSEQTHATWMFDHETWRFHRFEVSLEREVSPPYSWLLVSIMSDHGSQKHPRRVFKL